MEFYEIIFKIPGGRWTGLFIIVHSRSPSGNNIVEDLARLSWEIKQWIFYNTGSPQQKMSHMRIERVLLVLPRLIIVWATGGMLLFKTYQDIKTTIEMIVYIYIYPTVVYVFLAFWNIVYFYNEASLCL